MKSISVACFKLDSVVMSKVTLKLLPHHQVVLPNEYSDVYILVLTISIIVNETDHAIDHMFVAFIFIFLKQLTHGQYILM